MHSRALVGFAFASLFLTGCISVYHVAEKPGPDGDGVFVLASNGSDVLAGPEYVGGRDPHVTPDGSVVFVKKVPHSDGNAYYQVFRGSQPLTTSPGDKRNPAAGLLNLAYVHDVPGQGKQIVVQNSNGAVITQFASDANGLAFWDGGNKLLFSQRDGVYWIAASGGNAATRIVDCSATQPQGCGPLAVSHNGQYLAYYHYLALAPMRLTPLDMCPACAASQPGTPEDFGSFDFSPDDQWLYTTVRIGGPAGSPVDNRLLEIFRVKLNLGAATPVPTQPERLTTNSQADYHPSTALPR
jgi:hypothetical protein